MTKSIAGFSSVIVIIIFSSCQWDDIKVPEIYLEGEQIPGVEMTVPFGLYGGLPLTPRISPDGTKLLYRGLYGSPEQGLWIMDLKTQAKTLLHVNGRSGDWSPRGNTIAFVVGTQIFIAKPDGTNLVQLTFADNNSFPRWSPDGKKILFDNSSIGQYIIDTVGQIIKLLPQDAGGAGSWHPNGQSIISIKGYSATDIETKFPIYDLANNGVSKVISAVSHQGNAMPQFSPDGSRILFMNIKGIYVMDNRGGSIKRILPSHLANPAYSGAPQIWTAYPSWHPDGKSIVYEHFRITNSAYTADGMYVSGVMSFYQVNVDSAISKSNLEP